MKNKSFGLLTLLFAALLNCCQNNPVFDDVTNGEYISQKIALKSSVRSESEFLSNLITLRKKYSLPLSSQPVGDNLPPKLKGFGSILKKRGNTQILQGQQFIAIKSKTAPIERPYFNTYQVNSNSTFIVDCTAASSGGVDPFLVLYEVTNPGDIKENLTILGYNDDKESNSFLPRVTYLNSTDTVKNVVVLLFAYDEYSKGSATLEFVKYNNDGTGYTVFYRYPAVQAQAMFWDNSAINQNGVHVDIGDFTPIRGGSYIYGTTMNYAIGMFGADSAYCTGDSYIWVFNFSTMKGVANDDDVSSTSSITYTEPSWTEFSTSSFHYPNLVLLGGYSTGGTMRFLQAGGYMKN